MKLYSLSRTPLGLARCIFLTACICTFLPKITVSQVFNELPAVFPDFNITVSNNPGPGYYFLSGSYAGSVLTNYSIILDTLGFPVFYQKHQEDRIVRSLSKEETGVLSYYSGIQYQQYGSHILLDSTYNITDMLGAINGYFLDPHEFILKDDGSYWVLAYDIREVDMSKIVVGGHPKATVVGCVIQHISEEQNLLFQWNSWDHMEITDCDTLFVDLTEQTIDYVHANSLSFDYDENILLSSRHLNEITKIDVNTGDILWRWGGQNNQFTYPVSDVFFGQHTIRYNKGSNTYTLFDNGNWHNPPLSRGLEFELDQNQLIASLVNTYTHSPGIFTSAMGGMQRIGDVGTLLNWSKNMWGYVFTEYDDSGEATFEISCPDSFMICYRVEKHEWETSLFDFVDEELIFNTIPLGDSAFKFASVKNKQSYTVTINGHHFDNAAFSLETPLPAIIGPNETKNFLIKFKPTMLCNYKSVFSLFHSTDTSRIAQQLSLSGSTTLGIEECHYSLTKDVIIFPNPMKSFAKISLPGNQQFNRILIIDNMGKLILDQKINNQIQIQLSSENLKAGLYNIVLFSLNGIHNSKLAVVQ